MFGLLSSVFLSAAVTVVTAPQVNSGEFVDKGVVRLAGVVSSALRDDITSLSFQLGDYRPHSKRSLDFRFADHAFRLEKGDVLRVDVAGACAQFAPHSNVKGDQFAIREPKVAHNRVFAAESELVLRVTGE